MHKARPAAAAPSRLSVKRSVWGCLTCRRRKVKCLDRAMPCSACARLKLTCVPSFSGNFKLWKREQHREDDARSSAKPEAGLGQKPLPMPSCSQPQAETDTPETAAAPPPPPPQPHNPFGIIDARMPGPQTDAGQAPAAPAAPVSPTQSLLMMSEWSSQQPSPFDLDLHMSSVFGGASMPDLDGTYTPADFYGSPSCIAEVPGASGSVNGPAAPIGPQSLSPPQGFMYSGMDVPDTADTDPAADELAVAASRAPSPALSTSSAGDDDSDRSLVVYYKRNLSSFFSVKSYSASPPYVFPSSRLTTTISALSAAYSTSSSAPDSSPSSSPPVPVWNFYSYAIRAAEEQPDSPLSHSILAWTSAHLILRNRYTSDGHAQFRHYARARAAADELREELMTSRPAPHTRTRMQSTPPLRMFLATTLFLAYGDILSGDCAGLGDSLAGVTQMLASDWPRIRAELGAIEARILVWLSYLDLRARLWAPPTRADKKHGSGPTSLFDFLQAHNGTLTTSGISALRAHRRGGACPDTDGGENHGDHGAVARHSYYLAECFGPALPARELEEDLLQEPAKMLSDEIMGVYATILALEGWIAGIDWDHDQGLLTDLRDAKIQAIRANIARIHAESKVVHADLMTAASGADHVARTTFHRLVTTAKTLAATVLLKRVEAPRVRTDDASQAAAREIVQIARQLGQLGSRSMSSASFAEVPGPGGSRGRGRAAMAESSLARLPSVAGAAPHSLVWPMPVFVAGIELTDPVYQDWVLAYLADVASWGGTSTRRARELLRRVIQQQDASGRRVHVRDVVAEFGGVLI